jgi:hypothetical protein
MLNRERLNELNASAEMLAAQAEIYRGMLQADALMLQQRLGWVERFSGSARRVSPWVLGGVAATGVLILRRWGGVLRIVPTALSVWRMIRPFLGR